MNPVLQMPDAFGDDAVLYLLGEADAEVVARLSAVLRQDPAARTHFATLARLHGQLGEIGRRAAAGSIDSARLLAAGPPPELPETGRIVRRPWRPWTGWIAAASVATAAGLALVFLVITGALARPLLPTVAGVHGQVLLLRDGHEVAIAPGNHLRVGDRLLASGSLEIELQGGRFILTPGAEAVIQESDGLKRQIELLRGEVIADLSSPGAPLAVRTRSGTTVAVSDGSAVVRIREAGVEVSVSRGSVDVTTRDGGRRTLSAGGSLDLPDGGRTPTAPVGSTAHAPRTSG